MIKNYVLDTCTILNDPGSLMDFKENVVVIPIGVLEELDRFKKEHGELGKNSRDACRKLDELRVKGNLREGVELDNGFGGVLKVLYNGNLNSYFKEKNVDLHVLHIARILTDKEPDTPCIIVSSDINMRVRANALGLQAEEHEASQVKEDIDKGYSELYCDGVRINTLKEEKKVPIAEFADIFTSEIMPNHYLSLKVAPGGGLVKGQVNNILAKISPDKRFVEVLDIYKQGLRIKPKNTEQAFVLDALLDPRIKLVSIIGLPGCGKTILTAAAGLYLLTKTDLYYKMLISRPMVPMSNKDTMGFLPGDVDEKLDPWMRPIYDAFEVILSTKKELKDGREFVKQQPNIKIEPLAFIRGRSINDQFLLLDEAQNTSPLEVKTIITRAGEDSKVVLTGDIDQIDCPYLDKYSNGLTVATKSFVGSELAAHIVMSKGVRSRLSEEASHRIN